MDHSTTVVGLDVSKDWLAAAVLLPGAMRVTDVAKLPNDAKNLGRYIKRIASRGTAVFVYEAGPGGFDLFRQITALGQRCAVIAPSLTPRRPGDRVKTDRRDAENLARLYRNGDLTEIRVPTFEEEAARGLVRAREASLGDRMTARHRLAKFLLRSGRVFRDGRHWTKKHRDWLYEQRFDHPAAQLSYTAYLRAVEEADARLSILDRQVLDLAETASYAKIVGSLRSLKGIEALSAVTLATEVMDFRRFRKARAMMGYTGMVPSEHTTSFNPRRGAITKTGNAHIRRILIEAAWHYQRKGTFSRALTERRRSCDFETLQIAKRADDRLHRKFWRLTQRGLPRTKAVVAVARELAGFIWAIGVKSASLKTA